MGFRGVRTRLSQLGGSATIGPRLFEREAGKESVITVEMA